MTGNNEKQAEREAFEGAVRAITDPARIDDVLMRDGGEHYDQWPTTMAWEVWKARALLAQQPQADPVAQGLTLAEAKELIGLPETPHRLHLASGATVLGSKNAIEEVRALAQSASTATPVTQGLTRERALLREALAWIEGSNEPAMSLCADIRAILAQAAPSASEQQAEPVAWVRGQDKFWINPDEVHFGKKPSGDGWQPLYAAPAPSAPPAALTDRRCQQCNAPRKGDECHKCGAPTVEPCAGWEEPALPPIVRIRALAREVGYAVGVHGTLERDLDLIAAPWSEDAATLNYREVMQHIADGLGARLVEVEGKPLGRRACTIQMDGWYKPIDLSVCPMLAASPADQGEDEPDMFWDAYNPERCQDSVHNVVVEAYENGCNVGDIVEVQQAIRLHNIKVRIIAAPEDSEEISYELVEDAATDAAMSASKEGQA